MFWLLAFQYLTVLVFGKIIIRNLNIHIFDLAYVAVCIIAAGLFSRFGVLVLIVCVSIASLLLFIQCRDIKRAIIAAIEGVLISVVVDHIAQILSQLLHLPWAFTPVFMVLELCVGVVLFLIYRSQSNITSGTVVNSTKELILSVVTLLIVYGYILVIEQNTTDLYYIVFDLVFFLFFGVTNILIQLEHQRVVKRELKVKYQSELLNSNERYIHEMEEHYNEMRQFRHDYQNVILSLDEYLKTKDFDGMNNYYQHSLRPVGAQLIAQKYELEDISRVKSKEIKSILFNKLSAAQNHHTEVGFECPVVIEKFNMEKIDLVIALSIIIDNAIEATSKSKKGLVNVAMLQTAQEQVIIVENTIEAELPPLWQLKQNGYSTKGQGRGLGLSNLQLIIDKYTKVTLETSYTNAIFLQKLIIGMEKKDD